MARLLPHVEVVRDPEGAAGLLVRRFDRLTVDGAVLWRPRLSELPFDQARVTKLRRVVDYRRSRLSPPAPTARRTRA